MAKPAGGKHRIKASELPPDVLAQIEAANPPTVDAIHQEDPHKPKKPAPDKAAEQPANNKVKKTARDPNRIKYPFRGRPAATHKRRRSKNPVLRTVQTAGAVANPLNPQGVPQAADEWGATFFLMAVAALVLYLLISGHINAVVQVFTGSKTKKAAAPARGKKP